MKRIVFFHHYNSSLGAGLSLLHILLKFPRTDYTITVILPNIPGDLADKIRAMGIDVVMGLPDAYSYSHYNGAAVSFFNFRHVKNIIKINQYKAIVDLLIKKFKPDIVAVNSLTLFWIGKIAKRNGAKTICFHRETYANGLLGVRSNYIIRHLKSDFDAVAFISNYDLQQTGGKNNKFVCITDKVDAECYQLLKGMDLRKELDLPQNGVLVLYTGGSSKLKGADVIVKALCKTKHRNLYLVYLQYKKEMPPQSVKGRLKFILKRLLGKDYQYKIEKFIKNHNLQRKVILKPATDQVEKYFSACDMVVFPSTLPHQARPIYEAGIAKKPIIITDFKNTAEFVDESNGWLFKKKSSTNLAKILDSILDHPESAEIKVELNYNKCYINNNINDLQKELKEMLSLLE